MLYYYHFSINSNLIASKYIFNPFILYENVMKKHAK